MAKIAVELGFAHVSTSSGVGAKMIKMITRGNSASADAYLTPEIRRYVSTFSKGFDGGNLDGVRCEFMQSDGGLVNYKYFSGLKAILSGPAGKRHLIIPFLLTQTPADNCLCQLLGGVVGYARTSYDGSTPIVGFDMGGTSTDVSRYGGEFEHVFETTTAGVAIQSPQLDINTVAAGGGSILFWENGLFKVGPEVCKHIHAFLTKSLASLTILVLTERGCSPRPCLLPQGRPSDRHGRQPDARPSTTRILPFHLRPHGGHAARRVHRQDEVRRAYTANQ